MGWAIDKESEGCEWMECSTHVVTFNPVLTHDLDLGLWKSNFEKVLSYELNGRLTWNERDASR